MKVNKVNACQHHRESEERVPKSTVFVCKKADKGKKEREVGGEVLQRRLLRRKASILINCVGLQIKWLQNSCFINGLVVV